jgi:hypothetical protein
MVNEEIDKPISEYSVQELRDELDQSIKEYSDWVDKKFEITNDWIEEIEYMSFTRGFIHELSEEMASRRVDYDFALLKQKDIEWQKWIIATKEHTFKLEHPRDDKPKKFWWEWIDELAELSAEQRETL